MGDRYDRDRAARLKRFGAVVPPEPILTWGIGDVAQVPHPSGHNGGPPLEDEQPGYLWRKHLWTRAHKEAWKTPSMAVLKFRVARAEAAGVTYEQYMLELLDTGRHLQKEDRVNQAGPSVGGDKRRRAAAKPLPLGGPAPAPTVAPGAKGPAQPRRALPLPQPLGGSASGPSMPPRRK